MIGSDWPVCTVAGSYGQVMNIVVEYLTRYPESVQDAVLGGNAERLWQLRQRKGADEILFPIIGLVLTSTGKKR